MMNLWVNHHYKKLILILLLTFGINNFANCTALNVKILLDKIEIKQITEAGGDELYFSVITFSNKNPASNLRIPSYPLHYLSNQVNKLTPIVLWEQELQSEEAVNVIISLMEHDMPPWNLDDHIGSVKVNMVNQPARFLAKWSQPDFIDQPEVNKLRRGEFPRYVLKGAGGEYYLTFKLEYSNE